MLHQARRDRTGLRVRVLAGVLLLFAALGTNLSWPDAASAENDAIYNFKYYSNFKPNGTSRYYVVPQPGSRVPTPPPTPSNPPAPSQPPAPPAPGVGTPEQRMLALVNQARASAGVAPLQLDPVLTELARKKSQDMVDHNYFSHYSPTYGYPYNMELAAGIRAPYMGAENIADASDVEMAHWLLMASPGHRKNILDPRFTDIGIGIVPGGSGVIVTQLFIGR